MLAYYKTVLHEILLKYAVSFWIEGNILQNKLSLHFLTRVGYSLKMQYIVNDDWKDVPQINKCKWSKW